MCVQDVGARIEFDGLMWAVGVETEAAGPAQLMM